MIISKIDFLYQTHLDEETLAIWIAEEWLLPAEEATGDPAFTETDIARARLIRELVDRIGVNHQGIGIILDLIDQMHSLRRAVGTRLTLEGKQN